MPGTGQNPVIEFLYCDKLYNPHSAFGHSSIILNDTVFSYGLKGMTVMPRDEFLKIQQAEIKRESVGVRYEVDCGTFMLVREAAIQEWLADPGAWYDGWGHKYVPWTPRSEQLYDFFDNSCQTVANRIGRVAGQGSSLPIPKDSPNRMWNPGKRIVYPPQRED